MKKYLSLSLSSSFLLISTSAHSMYQTPLDEYNYEGRNGQKVMLITPGNNASSVTWNYQGYSFYDHNNPDESFDIVNLTNKIDLKSN